jgi:hypothetical protein
MANDSVLNIPIQINGDVTQSSTPSTLMARELYICKDGRLYYGNDQGNATEILPTKVVKQFGEENSPFYFNNETSEGKLFEISTISKVNNTDTKVTISNLCLIDSSIQNSSLSNTEINSGCKINTDRDIITEATVKACTLVVGEDSYGYESDMPSSGITGQLFFKLVN